MEDVTVNSFEYVHLSEVDPNFTLIDEGFYNLKLISAEYKEYDKTATGGKKGEFIKLGFAVTGDPKFSGRRVYPSALFPNSFVLKTLRRIQDASGVEQTGTIRNWVEKLNGIGPVLKLKVMQVPDANFAGVPNPRTVQADGSPGTKVDIDWAAGVQPGE